MEEDADPEFLELSERQRAAIDRAFNRGLRRPTKRRRLDRKAKSSARSTPAGGFLPEDDEMAGGFLPDDDAGGFIPDDEEGGGFVADEPSAASTAPATPSERVPIGRVPALLASLGLPSDEDVLSVFRASAAGWDDEEEGSGGAVSLKDWRAVCAALMTPGNDDELQDEGEIDNAEDDLSSLSSDEDDFRPSGDEDEEDEGSEYGKKSASATPAPRRRQKRQPKVHLSSQQKELGRDIWDMLKPQGGVTLSKEEVKKWAREMGEMWSDDEITDMVSMFASGANQLSFDQFCSVLLRAGLV
ncbi:hypothetical protein A1Q2_05448 [Trichosporon asahii var. asahii CBS 8904]|uniref:EF-hand domain-containing protein n=1 Tax=Trichosporon asahii var. asahii (strain CBS 8904) TaxID=1220162 RepID=K1VHF6_TRIAC|nr:hypothetical protein A1Q2_05448 [Trichosporon asahii var. asahii CBS 8904]